MAYRELIKNLDRTRSCMRDFYVYGFRSRREFGGGSARSYDDERRRIESWLGGYMSFRQDAGGKRVFLSVDSRRIPRNPLYQAFRAKSFTDRDITLHFCLLDLLAGGAGRTAGEITDALQEDYLSRSPQAFPLDESTVRKKLREYETLGLLAAERYGRTVLYRRADGPRVDLDSWRDAIAFFSEASPLGVVGSYLAERTGAGPESFRFKHHYILHALDSEVLYQLLRAIGERRAAELTLRRRDGGESARTMCPLKIYRSTQNGRQYVLGYEAPEERLTFFRLDNIRRVALRDREARFEEYEARGEAFRRNLWGVSAGDGSGPTHIEMTVRAEPNEGYILHRLEREKRGGRVEDLGGGLHRFSADVYDAGETLPWLRTFIGRITELRCGDGVVKETFREDLRRMAALYGGDGDAVP